MYAIILVPLVGASVSGLLNLRHEGALTGVGIIVPLLLGLAALCAILWIAGVIWKRQRRRATVAPVPTGECEAILQEDGWCFRVPGYVDPTTDAWKDFVAEDENGATSMLLRSKQAAPTENNLTENSVLRNASPSSEKYSLSPWTDLTETRRGDRVVVFLHEGGFSALPIRCLTEDQVGRMQRLISRKLRPQAAHTSSAR
jgi:hypothetical protein